MVLNTGWSDDARSFATSVRDTVLNSQKDRSTNQYAPSTPRTAAGLAAVAMASITMGALVVLPAKFDFLGANPYTVAKTVTKAPIEVANPVRIDLPEARASPSAQRSARKPSAGRVTHHPLVSKAVLDS